MIRVSPMASRTLLAQPMLDHGSKAQDTGGRRLCSRRRRHVAEPIRRNPQASASLPKSHTRADKSGTQLIGRSEIH
jgi:hypothetical protein